MAAAVRRIGNRLPSDKENEKTLAGKSHMYVKNAKPRAALGDIGNKAVAMKTFGKAGQNIGIAIVEKRGLKAVGRSNATSSLLQKPSTTDATAPKDDPMDLGDVAAALDDVVIDLTKIEDIDKGDYNNPQLCAEYVNEIYQYMRKLERLYKVRPEYMADKTQYKDINEKMRAILIDWLVQVHLRFHLLQETLYITVSIIDRFLQIHPVSKSELQLVGVGAMLLASKYEEMYTPEITDFVYITDNAYTAAEIRKMEALIFRTLDFNLGKPLCLHFLRRNSKAGAVDPDEHTMAKYFMELTLVDYASVAFLPSQIAAAALYLSLKCINKSEWTPTLAYYSHYSEDQLLPCATRMAQLIINARQRDNKTKAVHSKYAGSKFCKISISPCLSRSVILQDLAHKSGTWTVGC